jgi:hypothetical protein
MAEWIARTVQYFAGRPDVQLVIRIHPGEVLTHGQSMADVVRQVLPRLPEHIRLIGAKEKVNTYDLVEVADVGLVYTTTVGEMAMYGVPSSSILTHYRGRGFTYDPTPWVSYQSRLDARRESYKLTRAGGERLGVCLPLLLRVCPPFLAPGARLGGHRPARFRGVERRRLQQYDTFRYLLGETVIGSRSCRQAHESGQVTAGARVYDQAGRKPFTTCIRTRATKTCARSHQSIFTAVTRVSRHPLRAAFPDAGSGRRHAEYLLIRATATGCARILIACRRRASEASTVVADAPTCPRRCLMGHLMHTLHHLPLAEQRKAYGELHRAGAGARWCQRLTGRR